MNFLKENTFLVVMAAIVIVGVSAALLMASSWSGQTDTGAKPYVSTGNEIKSLASPGVNKDMVEAVEQRVKKMQNETTEVAEKFLLRNRRDYKVLSFDISGQTVPAFPIDPEFRDRETLKLLFPEKYRLRVESLRKELKPAVPPTSDEIDLEIARITASATPLKKDDLPKSTTPRPGESFHLPGARMERPTPGRMTGTSAGRTNFEQQATINMVIRKSKQGWIYADKAHLVSGSGGRSSSGGTSAGSGAMHVALPESDYKDDRLWLAQIGLWVQRDIVDAINLTNRQIPRTASGNRIGVAASAVKHLMSIDVRGYVLRSGGALQYFNLGEGKTSKTVPQLTERSCNKLYDVVHYDFTVVLPMRHLLRLQKNLMMQNYHTVLEVSVVKPVQSNMYYYGTDSVMKVTIVGEMLMLTDWTRGRWDKDAKDWDKNYPAMMPNKFLEQMRDIDAGAMRDEDNERLPKVETVSEKKRKG